MADSTLYAFFEILRVMSRLEHLFVVIGFDDEVVGLGDKGLHFVCDVSNIRHDTEANPVVLYAVAYAVHTVVGYAEGSDTKFASCERRSLLDDFYTFGTDFLTHAIIAVNADVNTVGSIDGQTIVAAQ